MAPKDIRFGTDARERTLRGIDILADAVKVRDVFTGAAVRGTVVERLPI